MKLHLFLPILLLAAAVASADPLPSWSEGPSRTAILDFVARVTTEGGPDYVPVSERIAVFDNDGTLWAEKPVYFQLMFILDVVRAKADDHPEWRKSAHFRAAIEGDVEGALVGGVDGLLELAAAAHDPVSPAEFQAEVRAWLETARHPRFDRPYTELVYQPMLELLAYLEANGFKNFIVSGGGLDFMRAWTEEIYGIPPERVVGTRLNVALEERDGVPVLVRMDDIAFIDDKEGKPVGIYQHIGRRPILAFGNSDGDHAMLRWTAAGATPRFMGLVHHTDADREYAYDRESHIGRLDAALDEASEKGWTVVDMKDEWKRVFPRP
jgi:phosphoglycolate phosphatase-like HAD superfamily hydrolase